MPQAPHIPSIRTRLLTQVDAVGYRQIRLEALAANPEAFASTFERERDMPIGWFEERLATSDVFGAFIDEALVGIAGFWRQDGTKTAHKAMLWGMYVRPAARNSGVGRSLVEAIVAHAAAHVEQLQLTVVAENKGALRLYESAGFVAYGREVQGLKQDGRYFDEILMTMFLDRKRP